MTIADGASKEDEILLVTERFQVVRRRRDLASGGHLVREIVEHPGASVILPLLDNGSVCLVRNYRLAVHAALLELPAGTVEAGESPSATAARELAEETGYSATGWTKLAELLMSPGILHERMHVFVATGLTSGKPSLQTGEEIETMIVPWVEAIAMIQRGRIQDAKTVAAILLYNSLHSGPLPMGRT